MEDTDPPKTLESPDYETAGMTPYPRDGEADNVSVDTLGTASWEDCPVTYKDILLGPGEIILSFTGNAALTISEVDNLNSGDISEYILGQIDFKLEDVVHPMSAEIKQEPGYTTYASNSNLETGNTTMSACESNVEPMHMAQQLSEGNNSEPSDQKPGNMREPIPREINHTFGDMTFPALDESDLLLENTRELGDRTMLQECIMKSRNMTEPISGEINHARGCITPHMAVASGLKPGNMSQSKAEANLSNRISNLEPNIHIIASHVNTDKLDLIFPDSDDHLVSFNDETVQDGAYTGQDGNMESVSDYHTWERFKLIEPKEQMFSPRPCRTDRQLGATTEEEVDDNINQATTEKKIDDNINHANAEKDVDDNINHATTEEDGGDNINQATTEKEFDDNINQSTSEEVVDDNINQASTEKEFDDNINQPTTEEEFDDNINQPTTEEEVDDNIKKASTEKEVDDNIKQVTTEKKVDDNINHANAEEVDDDNSKQASTEKEVDDNINQAAIEKKFDNINHATMEEEGGDNINQPTTEEEVDYDINHQTKEDVLITESVLAIRRRQARQIPKIVGKIHVRCSVCRKILKMGAFHEHATYHSKKIRTLSKRQIKTKNRVKITHEKPQASVTLREKCPVCSKVLNAHSLREHMLIHSGDKRFQCEICGKKFIQSNQLQTHRTSHSTEKPFKCHTCGRGFRLKKTLDSHMMTHTDERPCQCESCGKRFRSSGKLKRHSRVHTREKPYVCSICGLGFTQLSNMKNHSKRHAYDGGAPTAYQRCES